jgi:metaxin
MPPEVAEERNNELPSQSSSSSSFHRQTRRIGDFFSIPSPVKRLFDQVPVLTYASNELPQRAPKPSRIPSLYVFSTDGDVAAGRPSFNPSCLKWQVSGNKEPGKPLIDVSLQTYLNIAEIDHRLVSSNNHASPTGSLPFLQPATLNSSQESPTPVTSNKLVKYATEHGSRIVESSSMRYEAYQSLLDHRIRNAWVMLPCSMKIMV